MIFNLCIKGKKNYLAIIFLIIVLSLTLSSCGNKKMAEQKGEKRDYISITGTDRNEKDELIVSIFAYYPDNGETKKVIEFPYTAQYSLGVVDLRDNLVYLSKKGEGKGDQIFSYDLSTNKEEQLTDNLFAINYIIPTKEKIFFAACRLGERNVCLGSYDKKSKEISYWGANRDTNIENICIDEDRKSIYMSTYSEQEDRYNLQHQGNDNFVIPSHSVWKMDTDLKNDIKLFTKVNKPVRMVLENNSKLLAIYDHEYSDSKTPSESVYYDLEADKEIDFKLPPYRIQNGGAAFSRDGKSIYLLSQIEADGGRNLYEYNLEDGSYTLLFSHPSGFINNCQLIKK